MKRLQQTQIIEQLQSSKIILLTGPRLAGKEYILSNILAQIKSPTLEIDMSNKKERKLIDETKFDSLIDSFNGFSLVVIYEAQYLQKLQQIIDLLLDQKINCRLLLSCSFEPNIEEHLKEALKSQHLFYTIYPPTFYEIASETGISQLDDNLEKHLIYGNYPAVIDTPEVAQEILEHLLDTVLVTDLAANDRINKKEQLKMVLQSIAFFIGQPISYNEIATRCELDNETVERYIKLLEKAYILFKIPSYHTNKRYELKKSHVIYFSDTGIRNMLISNFNSPSVRMDMNELWSNWIIAERIKRNEIHHKQTDYWFWRTHTKQIIDFIEESDTQLFAYKTIWGKKKNVKFPALFKAYYPSIPTHTLNRSTYWAFLNKKS